MDISTGLIAAIGGAAVLATIAFRQLVDTVIQLNQELRQAIEERRLSEQEREQLLDKINTLEAHIIRLEARVEAQSLEMAALQAKVVERDRLIENLRSQAQLAE